MEACYTQRVSGTRNDGTEPPTSFVVSSASPANGSNAKRVNARGLKNAKNAGEHDSSADQPEITAG